MMMNREVSLHNRGATTIRTDYTQLGIPDHTTYAGPRPTYTNLPSDPLKQERVCATQEYSTPPIQPIATWVHAIPAIFPLPVHASSHSPNRVAKLRLTGVCG